MAGRTKGNKPGSRMDIIPDFGNIVFLALCFKDKSCSAAQKVVTNRLFLKQALEDCKDEIYNNLGKSRTEKPKKLGVPPKSCTPSFLGYELGASRWTLRCG